MSKTDSAPDLRRYEDLDDIPSNPSPNPTFGDVVNRRLGRRSFLRGALATTAVSAALGSLTFGGGRGAEGAQGSFAFEEIPHGVDEDHHVAPGYDADVLIRWGDPVLADAPAFDPRNQTAEAQEKQFGYNNDYIGFLPLPAGSDSANHGLLCINHEYTNEEVMFPGIERQDRDLQFADMTKEMVDIEMAAHGGSIIEVKKDAGGKWQVVPDSEYARRITMLSTEMRLSGPAAGHELMKTSADPSGTRVIGTLNNCAGGMTPWGTYLMAEENFHGYFWGDRKGHDQERNYGRYGVPGRWYAWGKFHDRFDINKEPNESNRFGWITEVDPLDPASTPVKRTALGRFKHEGAESIVNKDGRVVIYSGDDQRFDYLYKFVTEGKFDDGNREANRDLLDSGTLYVARFDADGGLAWLRLVHGEGPLTAENGFANQAELLIETRRAADLLGATPMDRPEDVEPNELTNKVYVMLTNNSKRKQEQVDAANPRANNQFGHIVEISPPDGDHAAETASWDILIKGGDPAKPEIGALWNAATTENGWFASPDNCAVDHRGNLWIATDQGAGWSLSGTSDGVWALETDGAMRGTGRCFYRVPVGAECCGPVFTSDDTTLFVAVQHPSVDGARAIKGFEKRSTFDDPATRWPDFEDDMPPRPSVVAITKADGGKIGT